LAFWGPGQLRLGREAARSAAPPDFVVSSYIAGKIDGLITLGRIRPQIDQSAPPAPQPPTQPQFAGASRAAEILLQSPAASEEAPDELEYRSRGALHSIARSGRVFPERATTEEAPPGGAAVFENSTACAPIGCGFAPWQLICASRFVNADGAQRRTAPELKPRRSHPVPATVYGRTLE